MIGIDYVIYDTFNGGWADPFNDGIMYCGVCFDVKSETANLQEGHTGIGSCIY